MYDESILSVNLTLSCNIYLRPNIPSYCCLLLPESMSHDHECVKAQCSIDAYLGIGTAEQCWQPSTLSRVHQEECHIVIFDKLLQSFHLFASLLYGLI